MSSLIVSVINEIVGVSFVKYNKYIYGKVYLILVNN